MIKYPINSSAVNII